jgi:AcrR family transcriptional regulator
MDTKRRQARGLRRMEQIIDAAAREFAEVGYDSSTTNSIAARADISPGSLYQYFRNKEGIAEALAERYATEIEATHDFAFDEQAAAELSPEAWIDRVVDPLIAFDLRNPSFKVLLQSDLSPRLAESAAALHDAVLARVDAVIAARVPHLSKRDRARAASVGMQIFKALIPMVLEAKASERPAFIGEMKTALRGYLTGLS